MKVVWNARTRIEATDALLTALRIPPEARGEALVAYALRFPLGLAVTSVIYFGSYAVNGYLLAKTHPVWSSTLAIGAFAVLLATTSTVAVTTTSEHFCVAEVTRLRLACRTVLLDTHPYAARITPHPTLTGASFRLEAPGIAWTLHSAWRARPMIDEMIARTAPDADPSHPAGGDDPI
jgi:hypothetical protein